MLEVAECYLRGKGVTENRPEALKWVKTAAKKGNGMAQWGLALTYDDLKEIDNRVTVGMGYMVKSVESIDNNIALYWYEILVKNDNVNMLIDIAKDYIEIRIEQLKARGFSSSKAQITPAPGKTIAASGSATATATFDWRSRITAILKKMGWNADGNLALGGAFLDNSRKTISLYNWANGTIFMGTSYDGYPHGPGLVIAAPGEFVEEWPDCSVYAGNFNKGVAVGGMSYNRTGKLLYAGMNLDGKGLDRVQPIGDAARKIFKAITYPANDDRKREFYIGETIDGKRHGYGMLKWQDDVIWIGEWSNDRQNGVGLYFYGSDGAFTIGKWENGEFVREL